MVPDKGLSITTTSYLVGLREHWEVSGGEAGRWTRQLWREFTRACRISIATLRRFSVASSGGNVVDNTWGLLVQSQERRNAENLSEAVPASPRALQRFLTESPWDDDRVIGRLQEYLGPRLEDPEAVWVLDGSDFPKQGVKSVGVARQYCGALGKIASCQAGLFLAHVGPRGRVLVDKRLYLPEEWTGDVERCVAAGVPEDRREYRSKTELALEMVERAQSRGHLGAQWVAGDSAFGMSPPFREGLAAAGMRYVLDVRPDMTVWPLEPTWTDPPYQGNGRPRKPRLRGGQRQTMQERAAAIPVDGWREITVPRAARDRAPTVTAPNGPG